MFFTRKPFAQPCSTVCCDCAPEVRESPPRSQQAPERENRGPAPQIRRNTLQRSLQQWNGNIDEQRHEEHEDHLNSLRLNQRHGHVHASCKSISFSSSSSSSFLFPPLELEEEEEWWNCTPPVRGFHQHSWSSSSKVWNPADLRLLHRLELRLLLRTAASSLLFAASSLLRWSNDCARRSWTAAVSRVSPPLKTGGSRRGGQPRNRPWLHAPAV